LDFQIVGPVRDVQVIARGRGIRELRRLRKAYGSGHWHKKKGVARIQLIDGTILKSELHWYEAHGIGKKEFKIKRVLEYE